MNNIKNVTYIRAKVLLEGVEIPYASVSVSYGPTLSIPTCTISLPASSELRSIPENTKVLVLYQDPVNYSSEADDWCVLFDGEIESFSYSNSAAGSMLTFNVIHSTSFLAQLQLILQEASCPLDLAGKIAENGALIPSVAGTSTVSATILSTIFDKNSKFETMSDLVYVLMKAILNEKSFSSPVSKWFQNKLLNKLKIPTRVSMVTDKAKTLDPIADKVAGG